MSHDIVFFEFNLTPSKIKQIPRNIPLYSKANWDTIKIEIQKLNNTLYNKANTISVDEMWNEFETKLNELVNQRIPHKKLSSKPRTPWVTSKTRTPMKKRDRLYKNEEKWKQRPKRQI